jgi:predicted O-methyltransferase YrrM
VGVTASLALRAFVGRDMRPHVDRLVTFASDARVIVEFGVRRGFSTVAFLEGLPADGRLFSVDVDRCPSRIDDPRWTFIRGDDRLRHVRRRLPRRADLVFIDTSHELEHTIDELAFARTLGPSVILCHDAYWPGVVEAVELFVADGRWRVSEMFEAHDHKGDFSLAVLVPA